MNRMRLEQIKLRAMKEGPRAAEQGHIKVSKRSLPIQYVEFNKINEPPVHIK